MLKLGMESISGLYAGGAKIKRGLVGTAVVYEAVRTPAVYTVSAAVAPASGGSVTGAGQYQEGGAVTLAYTPAEDHRFTGWYAGSTLLSQANPYTFTAVQDMAVTAKCEQIPTYALTLVPTGISALKWALEISVNEKGGMSWSGSGETASSPQPETVSVKGNTVTVETTIPDGYEFAGWQAGSGSVVTSNPYTFTITGDTTLYCRYAKKSRLPEGYTELQYVEFPSSSCYIQTPLIPGYISTVEAKFEIAAHNTGVTAKYLFYSSAGGASFYLYETKSGVKGKCGASSNAETTFIPNSTTSIIDASVASGKFTVNGTAASMGTRPSTNAGQIYLNGNGSNGIAKLRLYYWRSASASSTTGSTSGSDYVPCTNATGKVGLYNLRTKTFLSATSSTQLVAGPAV